MTSGSSLSRDEQPCSGALSVLSQEEQLHLCSAESCVLKNSNVRTTEEVGEGHFLLLSCVSLSPQRCVSFSDVLGTKLPFFFSDSLLPSRKKEWFILAGGVGKGVITQAKPLPSGPLVDPVCPQVTCSLFL